MLQGFQSSIIHVYALYRHQAMRQFYYLCSKHYASVVVLETLNKKLRQYWSCPRFLGMCNIRFPVSSLALIDFEGKSTRLCWHSMETKWQRWTTSTRSWAGRWSRRSSGSTSCLRDRCFTLSSSSFCHSCHPCHPRHDLFFFLRCFSLSFSSLSSSSSLSSLLSSSSSSWSFAFPKVLQPFLVILVMMALLQFSGQGAVTFYTAQIFKVGDRYWKERKHYRS